MPNNEIKFEDISKLYNSEPVRAGGYSKNDFVGEKHCNKIVAVKQMIELAEKNVSNRLKDYFDSFDIKFNVTSNEGNVFSSEIISAIDQKEDDSFVININLNLSEDCKLPPDALYAKIYGLMYKAVLKECESKHTKNDKFKFGKNIDESEEEEEGASNDEYFDRQGNYVDSGSIVKDIISFIKKLLGIEDSEAEKIYKNIHHDTGLFGLGKGKTGYISSRIHEANEQAIRAMNSGKVAESLNFSQQACALSNVVTKDSFNSLKSGNLSEVKEFCQSYARTFLQSNNIDPNSLKLTFEEKGEFGVYTDFGDSQTMNINLSKVGSSVSEMVMTLSHELTHAVDSSLNKKAGLKTEEGYGLMDNWIDGDISSARGEDEDVYAFLVELNNDSYYINPNERHARVMELSALEFMKKIGPDTDCKNAIGESIESYKNYQDKTIAALDKYRDGNGIENIKKRFDVIKGLIKNESTKTMIQDRIDYIEHLAQENMLDSESEKIARETAIKIGNEIVSGKSSQEENLGRELQ